MKEADLTYERAHELFSYDQDTGEVRRKKSANNRNKIGEIAGYINSQGYRCVSVDYAKIRIHRLVWLMVNGEWPDGEIDHIDHNKLNNKIENLRCVTHHENTKNCSMMSNNTSGIAGVSFDRANQKWESYISHNGKRRRLGRFETLEQAAQARKKAEADLNFHANHGKRVRSIENDSLCGP